ncbi:hypothetical protein PG999_011763 [Apiospora kogelbergensis]|uniref:Uncharacterized protein n=1 Tax=Apiospora kogelbergensis TaxID=1337665 RepID=A0AAW0QQB0_9PEZI
MPSFTTVSEYTCGHTQEVVHFRQGEDERVVSETLRVTTRCRTCILRAVLSVVNPTITALSDSAIQEVREEMHGMGPGEVRRYFKALSQRVCRPSDAQDFQDALGEFVACR